MSKVEAILLYFAHFLWLLMWDLTSVLDENKSTLISYLLRVYIRFNFYFTLSSSVLLILVNSPFQIFFFLFFSYFPSVSAPFTLTKYLIRSILTSFDPKTNFLQDPNNRATLEVSSIQLRYLYCNIRP